jgi:Zn-dependent peptidase ImmA (M78 family)
MSHRREISLQLSGELDIQNLTFSIQAHLSEPAAEVGQRLRETLGVTAQEQLDWDDEWQAWRRWRQAVESAGVLVFQFPKVSLSQAIGVSLLRSPLPAIGINSKASSPALRCYTLMHELVHIALACGREEQTAQLESRDDSAWAQVERFAEEVASHVLIPAQTLTNFLTRMSIPRDTWNVPLVRQLAGKFRVTPLAMATRLRAEGAMTWDGYRQWKQDWDAYVETLPPRRGGFATPLDKALSRGGRPFAQLVLQALDANRITSVDACRYLELRFDYVEKLRLELRGGPSGVAGSVDDGD